MPEELLLKTLQLVQKHPWWQARSKLALVLLRHYGITAPASVLDVGCGWGVNLQALESGDYRVTGLDVSRKSLERHDAPTRSLIEADLTQDLPAPQKPFDAVLALDVIEHLDDDRSAVKRMGRLLRPQGLALISVPARPDLFSDFDRIQGHRRRYVPETLRSVFEGSGLDVLNIFWWGAWQVPVLQWMRGFNASPRVRAGMVDAYQTYANYLKLPPWPGPLFMRALYKFEQRRAVQGRLKTGTSLFAAARLRSL